MSGASRGDLVVIGGYHEQDMPAEAVKNLPEEEKCMVVRMMVAGHLDSETKKLRARREKLNQEEEEGKRRKAEEHC